MKYRAIRRYIDSENRPINQSVLFTADDDRMALAAARDQAEATDGRDGLTLVALDIEPAQLQPPIPAPRA